MSTDLPEDDAELEDNPEHDDDLDDDTAETEIVAAEAADPDGIEVLLAESATTEVTKHKGHAKTGMNRTVWVLAAVAVLSLGVGLVVGMFVKSPAQIAAEAAPPEAGPITVEVESRVISADILARGDVVYDDAVALSVEVSDIGGPAVVTGAVPEVGAEISAGSVVLEIAGRPVLALPGDLPVYRTLRAGASGPDVVQLQAALNEMGYGAGTSGTYDAATAGAVSALFANAGYPAPDPGEAAREQLRMARDGVNQAESGVVQAQSTLDQASKGVSESERISANNMVNSAQRAYNDAWTCNNSPAPVDPETGQQLPRECPSLADAEDALQLAKAQRNEILAAPDTTAERENLDAARRNLDDARELLRQSEQDVLTPLPASEVVYLANLPRRVDSVNVERGSIVTGPIMTVSGATLEIVANLADADAALVTVGEEAVITAGDLELAATVAEITKQQPGSGGEEGGQSGDRAGRTYLILHPADVTEEEREEIYGRNVRIVIPVSSTDGAVLAVPDAALTAGPGGEVRVEILRPGQEAPELVVVQIGLSANGYTEITSARAPLEVGDLVVVGQRDGSSDSGATPGPGSEEETEETEEADGDG